MEGSKVGGGEVRKAHIVYFLSHGGKIEQPHLVRVHHLHRNGVHLRDVKRWLSDVRGEDMPDSFAWSYKRKYKSGYVWQDLKDDDLITPFSDNEINEYVLKGSDLPQKTESSPNGMSYGVRESTRMAAPKPPLKPQCEEVGNGVASTTPAPTSAPAEISEEPVERAGVVRIGKKPDQVATVGNNRRINNDKGDNSCWRSGRKALLLNLLTCGAVETNGSAMTVHRPKKNRSTVDHNKHAAHCRKSSKSAADPNCLHCGKAFKPEKLHSHMKSCHAFRAPRQKGTTWTTPSAKKKKSC